MYNSSYMGRVNLVRTYLVGGELHQVYHEDFILLHDHETFLLRVLRQNREQRSITHLNKKYTFTYPIIPLRISSYNKSDFKKLGKWDMFLFESVVIDAWNCTGNFAHCVFIVIKCNIRIECVQRCLIWCFKEEDCKELNDPHHNGFRPKIHKIPYFESIYLLPLLGLPLVPPHCNRGGRMRLHNQPRDVAPRYCKSHVHKGRGRRRRGALRVSAPELHRIVAEAQHRSFFESSRRNFQSFFASL